VKISSGNKKPTEGKRKKKKGGKRWGCVHPGGVFGGGGPNKKKKGADKTKKLRGNILKRSRKTGPPSGWEKKKRKVNLPKGSWGGGRP